MRTNDPGSKRDAIVAAATELFLSSGYAGTSMDMVAQHSKSARRTVYNQFASKEALFEAVVESLWQELKVPTLTGSEALDLDAREGLTRIGQAVAEFWVPETTVGIMRMVISEGSRFPDLPHKLFAAGKTPTLDAVASCLGALQGKGLKPISDRALATRQFLGLINEPLLWARVIGVEHAPSAKRRTEVVAQAVTVFMNTYGEP